MLTTSQLESQLRGTPLFIGVFACDALPTHVQAPATLIVNTDSSSEPGEHWVAIHLLGDERADFFCPFGFPPLIGPMQTFLHRHGRRGLRYNQCTMQDASTTLCGDFCICFVRCVARGLSLPQFVSRFRSGGDSIKRLICLDRLSC